MSRISELAERYVAATRDGDELELIRIQRELAPSEWTSLMDLVGAELPELVAPLDGAKLQAAAERHGLDAATAAAVTKGLTSDLADLIRQESQRHADLAERFCEAAPSLGRANAGRVRFHLGHLQDRLHDARKLGEEAFAALASATGHNVEYLRSLASAQGQLYAAGMAARAEEQQVGEQAQPRVLDPLVDPLFGIDQ